MSTPVAFTPRFEQAFSSIDDFERGYLVISTPQTSATATNGSIKSLCALSWSNVTVTVDDGKKVILNNITGRSAPGELTAIMGPSGSGKTTLLDILADRVSSYQIEGIIELNGEKRDSKTFRGLTSYVAQEDSLLGSFTVLETLKMAAQLSLLKSVTKEIIIQRVEEVIDEMGLRSCQDTIVGDIFRKGISGGQKRRLSIAIELLANPSILLIDEPTSGLDSSATYNVMKCITKLCEEGKTVICTIHQPSSLVYDMFTNVMILSGGETVYFGPRANILNHFTSLGYKCPLYSNPAEYFISLVNTDFEGHVDISRLVHAYVRSSAATNVVAQIELDHRNLLYTNDLSVLSPSMWRQFSVLMYRNSLNNIRNPGIYWVRLFMYITLSVMVGTMYLSTNDDLTDEDLVPMLCFLPSFLIFMSVAVLPFFIDQRAVFLRERANSSLHVGSYVIANLLAAIPGIFMIALICSLLVVYLTGLNSFGYFLLNLSLSLITAESLMHVISAVAPHYIIGIALGAGIFGMFILCEGFMVPRDSIPDYWIWAYYLDFQTYSYRSFVYGHFHYEGSASAKAVLERLNVEDVNMDMNAIILVGYALVLQLIFFVVLYKFHTGQR